MSIKKQLEAAIRPGQYVVIEKNNHPHDAQVTGYVDRFTDVSITLYDEESDDIAVMYQDINCIMDNQCAVLWPREEA